MNTRVSLLVSALCCLASVAPLRAQPSPAFTYQGRLTSGGNPASGPHDFQFTLFGAESDGSPVEDPVTFPAVGVTNGLFVVPLNFGANVFAGQERWLDIAVRLAGGGEFTPLTPRQPITPTPYALTALNALKVPGVDGHSLHSAEGGPIDAVFVDNDGKVGVGTTTPASQLQVVSRPDESAPPRLQSTGDTRFNAGWDFYHGTTGKGYVGVPDANAPIAPGELVLFGGPGTKTSLWAGGIRVLTAYPAGSVGIGTATPTAALDVRGSIKLGPDGELLAPGSEENLRLVRGTIFPGGQIVAGSGFTVSHDDGSSIYVIHFTTPFAARPSVTATIERTSHNAYALTFDLTKSQVSISLQAAWEEIESTFDFIAIGPR